MSLDVLREIRLLNNSEGTVESRCIYSELFSTADLATFSLLYCDFCNTCMTSQKYTVIMRSRVIMWHLLILRVPHCCKSCWLLICPYEIRGHNTYFNLHLSQSKSDVIPVAADGVVQTTAEHRDRHYLIQRMITGLHRGLLEASVAQNESSVYFYSVSKQPVKPESCFAGVNFRIESVQITRRIIYRLAIERINK